MFKLNTNLSEIDGKYCMRSATGIVHTGTGRHPSQKINKNKSKIKKIM